MIFYLGEIVKGKLKESDRKSKNLLGYWKYGYDKDIDVVIISKDGTLGEIYNVMGLNIGLPEKPKDKDILNYDKRADKQKFVREEMPSGLTEETMNYDKYADYITEEFRRREEGFWCFIKGEPVFINGTYYFGVQWCKENVKYSDFRIIQNELMLFWEACKADERCYGMDYVKNRRFGASLLAIVEQIESATINEDKILGIVSKKGNDSKKIFRRLIKSFRRLPCFFRPIWDGTNNPKTELVLEEPTKRKAAGEKITEGDGLGSVISWHNTEINAMDGENIFRSLLDEAGKYPKEVPFSEYWYIVKTSHRLGSNIVGKSMVVSTVNAMKKGGSEFKKIWDDSDANKRNNNGQTKSGLYRIFIAAKYGLEGFYDEYGFSIVKDPEKPTKNDLGKFVSIGSETYLKNEEDALRSDPEKLNEHKRQFPETEQDAFRDESGDCEFNLIKLQEQIEYNKWDLEDTFETSDQSFSGNNGVTRGNFQWENGIKDSVVVWRPDAENGRFFIKNGCFPPLEYRNKFEERWENGILSKAPLAKHIGAAGVDPYNRSRTVDNRGSFGAYHLVTKEHTCDDLPNNQLIVEYIDRPRKVELFFEDIIMVSVFYSMPFLSELSNERFLAYIKDRGYRHYSLNNPFKKKSELSPTEKEFGGAPQQDSKIGDAQFYATESYIEDYLGISMDERKRPIGDMGDFPFSRTLYQLKDVDTNNRGKFDAYIAFSLALLANKRIQPKQVTTTKETINFFQTYNNKGLISKYN
jgi:hypothetical protein